MGGAEYRVDLATHRRCMEMGIDVFPYHFPFRRHLKHPTEHAFSNQGITVREPRFSIWAERPSLSANKHFMCSRSFSGWTHTLLVSPATASP
jgi:hypothetical protein